MQDPRFNGTKVTLRSAFIADRFELGGEKESKYEKKSLFWGSLQELEPLAFERRIYAFFRSILVCSIFWSLPLIFRR